MDKHKAGLHKDVSTIFNGVWNPERDNLELTIEEPEVATVAYVHPEAIALDNRLVQKKPRFATIVKVFAGAPGSLFHSKARRERKRLLSISKHLLINQSS